MTELYLVQRGKRKGQRATCWSPPAYDLRRQPQRPGELCSEILVARPASFEDFDAEMAQSGLPEALWATLLVEGYRVTGSTAEHFPLPADAIADLLDEAADGDPPIAVRDMPRTRMTEYADALGTAEPRPATASIGPVQLRPATTVLAAWTIAAARLDTTLENWARDCLRQRCGAVVAWEIAAARGGQTLAEWAVVQAARRLRSRRTAPQTAA